MLILNIFFIGVALSVHALPLNNGLFLECNENTMTFYMKLNVAVDPTDTVQLKSKSASCKMTRNETHVFVKTGYTECGTRLDETEDFYVFKNIVVVTPQSAQNVIIARNDDIPREYEMQCSFLKEFRTTVDTGLIHIVGKFLTKDCENFTLQDRPNFKFSKIDFSVENVIRTSLHVQAGDENFDSYAKCS